MNTCLDKGKFPKAWKNGKAIIIRKDDDRKQTNPKAYRPIMLLSVLGKLLKKFISGRLLSTIHNSGVFSEKQYGFRENKSIEDAILSMVNMVKPAK